MTQEYSNAGDEAAHALNAARHAVAVLEHAADAQIEEEKAARLSAEQERDEWRRRYEQQVQEADDLRRRLAQASEQTAHMHEHMLALHGGQSSDGLPMLILEISMRLSGAEQGLYTEPDGDGVLASVGIEAMTHVPQEALYDFTRQAAREGIPVVRNDSVNLPDGPQLVNLAAVPVALRGGLSGVIMVANKRSGPFTDDDTEVLLSVGRHAGVALQNRKLHEELGEAYEQTVAVLADAIMAKDAYTRGHCEDVAFLAARVAEKMGFKNEALEEIRFAALLHDVGKIGISDGILLKPGKLSPEERRVIEGHSQIGSDLVGRVRALAALVPLIRHHHERVDGKGYPDGLIGDNIPLAARIIGTVDALDAMTSPRPYRLPVSRDEALTELRRCAGEQFDARIVSIVADVLHEEAEPG